MAPTREKKRRFDRTGHDTGKQWKAGEKLVNGEATRIGAKSLALDLQGFNRYRTASLDEIGERTGQGPKFCGEDRIMPGKKWLLMAIAAAFLAGNGCCRFCERWCGHNYQTAPINYAQPAACVPCCPPQPVCCPVGTAPAAPVAPQQGFQRSYYYVDPCCR